MPNKARQGDMEKKIKEMEAAPKLSEVDTNETEKAFAEMIIEDPGVAMGFKGSFFQKLEALNGRR